MLAEHAIDIFKCESALVWFWWLQCRPRSRCGHSIFVLWFLLSIFFTRRRSWSFAEYCKHFVARLNDVHAFGYNSAGSERIWMKFGELRVYCLELFLTNFGRDPRRSGSGRASRNFVFCPLNNAHFHRLPVGQISRHLHKKTCFRVICGAFGKHLWKFARKASFFPKKPPFWLDQS